MATRVRAGDRGAGVALGACGDDDDDAGADVSEEAHRMSMRSSRAQPTRTRTSCSCRRSRRCVGARFVEIVGVDRLEERASTPEDFGDDSDLDFSTLGLSEDEATRCTTPSAGATSTSAKSSSAPRRRRGALRRGPECVADAFDEDLLRRILSRRSSRARSTGDDEELMGDVFAVFAECPGAAPD